MQNLQKNFATQKVGGSSKIYYNDFLAGIYVRGKKTSINFHAHDIYLFIIFFFYILQVLIYMIEYISIKMISNRNLEYYAITKEGVFFYNSIYFIGSLFLKFRLRNLISME